MIKVKQLHKYYNDLHVLKGINLEIKEQEVVAVIGSKGSGKSTLLRCISLGIKDAGEITFKGTRIDSASMKAHKVNENIRTIFRHFNLFPHKTVLENIIESLIIVQNKGKKEAICTGMKLLEKVHLADKAHVYPEKLTGGQKQRVAVARVLAMNPSIILFDDPTSALDSSSTREVLQVMEQLADEGATMLIVTEEMDFIRKVADRILFLENGVIVKEKVPQHCESQKREL